MCCLNIVWVIVPPRSAHSFRILVVRNNVVVVRKLFMTDRAYAALQPDFAVQQLSHFCRRSKFPESTRMMRVFDSLHAHPQCSGLLFLSSCFPAAAKQGPVDRAEFIATQPHDGAPKCAREKVDENEEDARK